LALKGILSGAKISYTIHVEKMGCIKTFMANVKRQRKRDKEMDPYDGLQKTFELISIHQKEYLHIKFIPSFRRLTKFEVTPDFSPLGHNN
jgi:hypothetical protein